MYKQDFRDQVRSRYVDDGLTFEELALESKVSLSTLKLWGGREGWKQARQDRERSGTSLDEVIGEAKLLVAGKLVGMFDGVAPFDSQAVYATVKAGVLLLLLKAESVGRGNPDAVLAMLDALAKNDNQLRRILRDARGTVEKQFPAREDLAHGK